MIDAVTEALAGQARVVIASDLSGIAQMQEIASDSTGSGDVVVMIVPPTVSKRDRAMLIAAIAALAVDMAPRVRVAALDLEERAAEEDLIAAARFLAGATSSTGQVLRVGARD